jgi:hypothetical protein
MTKNKTHRNVSKDGDRESHPDGNPRNVYVGHSQGELNLSYLGIRVYIRGSMRESETKTEAEAGEGHWLRFIGFGFSAAFVFPSRLNHSASPSPL